MESSKSERRDHQWDIMIDVIVLTSSKDKLSSLISGIYLGVRAQRTRCHKGTCTSLFICTGERSWSSFWQKVPAMVTLPEYLFWLQPPKGRDPWWSYTSRFCASEGFSFQIATSWNQNHWGETLYFQEACTGIKDFQSRIAALKFPFFSRIKVSTSLHWELAGDVGADAGWGRQFFLRGDCGRLSRFHFLVSTAFK